MVSNKKRYFLRLSYDGTNFCGWQNQLNQESVQGTIENALTILCKSKQSIVGCGRTDTGVHADDYYAHWDYSETLDKNIILKLNAILPRSIAIKDVFEVPLDINSRFQATQRTYHYHLHTAKNPFKRLYSYEYPFYPLQTENLTAVASLIKEYTEFLPLIKLNKDQPKTNCTILKSQWIQTDETSWYYEVSANRFLHNMVRRIVGTCILAGRNRLSLDEIRHSLDTQTEMKYVLLAPANGLHLVDISYPFLNKNALNNDK